MLSRTPRREGGFLLVELLAAMVLMGVVFAAFAEFASVLTSRTDTLGRQAYLSAEGRAGVDALTNELESAMCNGTTQPVTEATPTTVQFTAPDRQTPYALRQLTYAVDGSALTRQVATGTYSASSDSWTLSAPSAAAVVVDSLESAGTVFKYYDSSGTDLSPHGGALSSSDLAKVARVTVNLTVVPQASHGTGALTLQGGGAIRTWSTEQQCPS